MKTAANYLDAIRTKYQLDSDRKAAALLGIKNASRLRAGEDAFSDSTAARVAELLDTDPGEVLLSAHAERARDERTRALWVQVMKKAGYAAGVVMLSAGMAGAPAPAQSSASPGTIGIM